MDRYVKFNMMRNVFFENLTKREARFLNLSVLGEAGRRGGTRVRQSSAI